MILILSHSYYEQGTDPVIDWLLYYNVSFIKIAVEDLLYRKGSYSLDINKGRILFEGIDITDRISVIFYRRFYRYLRFESRESLGDISRKIFHESNSELESITNYLFAILKNKKWLPRPEAVNINKLETIYHARELGLHVPESIVTNSKQTLSDFYQRNNQSVIYKPINRLSYYTFGRYTYSCYTTKMTDEIIDSLPEHFFPGLFQRQIKYQYEIRVFYIDGNFYATAVLTSDPDREVDIKRSFGKDNIHWINYNLPPAVMEQLHKLMLQLDLNTGSVDLIYDLNGRYNFIEVNPVGQYLAPSFDSNYYVEKIIAEWLIKNN